MRRVQGGTFALVLVSLLVAPITGRADPESQDPTWPGWMAQLQNEIDPPTGLSTEDRQTCDDRLLTTLNQQFEANFTSQDMALIDTPTWAAPDTAFMRGGGYNIRIVASGLSEAEVKRIHAGRFIGHIDGFPADLEPSLHVPGTIGSAQVFASDATAGTVDFVAHIDTAYAYTPLGFIVHMIRDVWGAKGRKPCP